MSKESTSNGISLGGFIFLIFLFLKLAGIGMVANWSWWWVTSPLWIGLVLVFGFIGLAYCISGILMGIDWLLYKFWKNRK